MQKLGEDEIRERVRAIVAASPLRDRFAAIRIEPEIGLYDDEYLRIVLEPAGGDLLDLKDRIRLTEAIQDALTDVEERFPSVRFAEAA